ncbi:MAG: methyltransferase, TIGR04325 family [Rubrivivax sp.]|nr:methyltransferase, TIGR04325 family [Rubrivivax sp.]
MPTETMDPALQTFLDNRDQNLFYGVHDTWEAAEAAARSYGRAGYDNTESAAIYDYRLRIDQHDYPSLYWLTRSWHEGLRSVFDIGGAIGIKFIAFRDAHKSFPDLAWRVCDVPAMAAHGAQLAQERGDAAQLTFTSRYEEGDGLDILFASGVLQYLPKTLGEIVAGHAKKPRRIIINTAAVHPEFDFFTVNSIGTAFCPYRVQTQATVTRGLTRLGYRLREAWINPDKPLTLPHDPEHSLRHYSGYCFDLATGSAAAR